MNRKTDRRVRTIWAFLLFLPVVLAAGCGPAGRQTENNADGEGPIRLHPQNPHYFLYKGKTLAIVSSAEHYGAVINLDFDYRRYLETLAAEGMNYTRLFAGTYFEVPGESFRIENNTLAPRNGRVITPWKKVTGPGGNEKYDLSQWNDAYFDRLKDFVRLAQEKDIIVEITLFSSVYADRMWNICPQNPANNINLDPGLSRREVHTLQNGKLFGYQAALVRKLVHELNDLDNFFFEIQNEPWSDRGVPVYNLLNQEDLENNSWTLKVDFADAASLAWQDSLAAIIATEEEQLGRRHLIAQNYANFGAPVPRVSDHISVINFHYDWPEAVRWNYHYDRVVGFDESGFAGSGDKVYRRQAWKFMLSGGGLFNNLDYSFFVGHEDGTGVNNAPGGGSKILRRQLKTLRDFLESFPLGKMHPNCTAVVRSPGLIPYLLSAGDEAYAVYLRAVGTDSSLLQLRTGKGTYRVTTLNTITGVYDEPQTLTAVDGLLTINVEIADGELALKIIREE
jgi:hypothetical protein